MSLTFFEVSLIALSGSLSHGSPPHHFRAATRLRFGAAFESSAQCPSRNVRECPLVRLAISTEMAPLESHWYRSSITCTPASGHRWTIAAFNVPSLASLGSNGKYSSSHTVTTP